MFFIFTIVTIMCSFQIFTIDLKFSVSISVNIYRNNLHKHISLGSSSFFKYVSGPGDQKTGLEVIEGRDE